MIKEELMDVMIAAIAHKHKYVGVIIEAPGNRGRELIINPACNLKSKLDYYMQAYDDDMRLIANNKIRIVRAFYFSKFESLSNLDLSYSDTYLAELER